MTADWWSLWPLSAMSSLVHPAEGVSARLRVKLVGKVHVLRYAYFEWAVGKIIVIKQNIALRGVKTKTKSGQ